MHHRRTPSSLLGSIRVSLHRKRLSNIYGTTSLNQPEMMETQGKKEETDNILRNVEKCFDLFSFCNPHRRRFSSEDNEGIYTYPNKLSPKSIASTLSTKSSNESFLIEQQLTQQQAKIVPKKPKEYTPTQSHPGRRLMFPKQKLVKEIIVKLESPRPTEVKGVSEKIRSPQIRNKLRSMVEKIDSSVESEVSYPSNPSSQPGNRYADKEISSGSSPNYNRNKLIFSLLLLTTVIFVGLSKSLDNSEISSVVQGIATKVKKHEIWVHFKNIEFIIDERIVSKSNQDFTQEISNENKATIKSFGQDQAKEVNQDIAEIHVQSLMDDTMSVQGAEPLEGEILLITGEGDEDFAERKYKKELDSISSQESLKVSKGNENASKFRHLLKKLMKNVAKKRRK